MPNLAIFMFYNAINVRVLTKNFAVFGLSVRYIIGPICRFTVNKIQFLCNFKGTNNVQNNENSNIDLNLINFCLFSMQKTN